MSPTGQFSRARIVSLGMALLLAIGVLGAAPAQAAPRAPGGLTPSGVTVSGTPVLQWNRVSAGASYRVEVSSSSSFTSTLWSTSTVNRRAVPDRQLPVGEVWWRVKAVDSTGSSAWSIGYFDRSSIAGPTLVSPASGSTLSQPGTPALLSWTAVAGATGYTIEIDDADDFIGATAYSTKTTSYVVPKLQVATTYYWRVRATLATGIFSEWSETRTYDIGGLTKPVLQSPNSSPDTQVQDVVLDWAPVRGASTYDLQVSTDQNFLTFDGGVNITGIKGTRYSPPTTLNNDQFYWRVRPTDVAGNKLDWSAVDVWQFQRHWPEQTHLEYPVNGASVDSDVYYQWTGVKRASGYRLELSLTPDFPAALKDLYRYCYTVHTTYVPENKGDCWPPQDVAVYWRVVAFDDPANVISDYISGEVGQFIYEPGSVSLNAPADGDSVAIPTFSWNPVANAARYRITITPTDGGSGGHSRDTAATTYTSRSKLTVGKTYRWQVQTISESGRLGSGLLADSQRTFKVVEMPAATSLKADPIGPTEGATYARFPSLSWQPVQNATSYKLYMRRVTSSAWTAVGGSFPYPVGTDETNTWLAADNYQWRVEAYNGSDVILNSLGAARGFTISDLPKVTGQHAALTGAALSSTATSCAEILPNQCLNMKQTPALEWDAQPGAGSYMLYISRDKEMTNLVLNRLVDQNRWMYTKAFADSQAGSAYYWLVLPCKSGSITCSAITHATHAFAKKTNGVELLSPAQDATVQNDVTFTWKDYLDTNLSTGGVDATGVNSRLEARQYHIQVSTDPNFQTTLEQATVDQLTYTSAGTTYPEGPVYWRVQAIDGSNNPLAWSATRSFLKRSPLPVLQTPANGSVVSSTQPFRWLPLDFASSYDVEVYKDGDTTGSSINRVLSGNSKQVAFTTTNPLPASDKPYVWRVRRVDAAGRKGGWSELSNPGAAFKVVGTKPVLTGPAAGAWVASRDALFTWQAVAGVTSYRFERRLRGTTSNVETVTTPNLAWAPVAAIRDGGWEWRVSSIDAGGKVIASSAWQAFGVDGTRPTVTSKSPTGIVKRGTNFTVRFSEPVTRVSTTTFSIVQKGRQGNLSAAVTVSADRRSATLNPKLNLSVGKYYVIRLNTGIKDARGNALVATSWTVKAK